MRIVITSIVVWFTLLDITIKMLFVMSNTLVLIVIEIGIVLDPTYFYNHS